MPNHLLLDIGGVVIRSPFELLDRAEQRAGLAPGALGRRGPFDPDGDAEFDDVAHGELTERAYWQQRAARAAGLLGTAPDTRAFMRELFDLPEAEVVRPEVEALVDDALRTGRRVGLLTNDLIDFHGQAWVDRMTTFARVHVLVDVSQHGVLKPDPRAYRLGIDALGVPARDIVYLDDQPVNVTGARQAGFEAILVDVTDPAAAVAKARVALGLA